MLVTLHQASDARAANRMPSPLRPGVEDRPEPRVSVSCLCHGEGTGGEEIGQMLAEQLGFRYTDRLATVSAVEAIVHAAADPG
jgi:hypothetical protein